MHQQTDHEQFSIIFTQYKKRFVRFAYIYLRNEFDAENIVMDALVYYWEHRHQLENNDNIPAYIFKVIKHNCLNYLKKQQIHESVHEKLREHANWEISMRISSLERHVPEEIFSKEANELVNKALLKLPAKTRKIFLLNRTKEKSYAEIAMEEDMSVKNVEYHMSKALKVLRTELKEYMTFLLFFY
ncbi:MAG: RNA polymerase sigma-70 factor [Bacteroidales bacterium]